MSGPGFLPISKIPLTKVEDNRDWCVGNDREAVTISIPGGRCPLSPFYKRQCSLIVTDDATLLASDWSLWVIARL